MQYNVINSFEKLLKKDNAPAYEGWDQRNASAYEGWDQRTEDNEYSNLTIQLKWMVWKASHEDYDLWLDKFDPFAL